MKRHLGGMCIVALFLFACDSVSSPTASKKEPDAVPIPSPPAAASIEIQTVDAPGFHHDLLWGPLPAHTIHVGDEVSAEVVVDPGGADGVCKLYLNPISFTTDNPRVQCSGSGKRVVKITATATGTGMVQFLHARVNESQDRGQPWARQDLPWNLTVVN